VSRFRQPLPPRLGPHRSFLALVGPAATALCIAVAALSPCGCGSAPAAAPTATVTPPTASPSPGPTLTSGPVPPAAARAATRFWRLVDAHRDAALLRVVTPDSQAAAALRAGRGDAFWGIRRVHVVSIDAAVRPSPPTGATLEFAMTVDIRPAHQTAWNPGRNLVYMSLRRVGATWLVCAAGSGP